MSLVVSIFKCRNSLALVCIYCYIYIYIMYSSSNLQTVDWSVVLRCNSINGFIERVLYRVARMNVVRTVALK